MTKKKTEKPEISEVPEKLLIDTIARNKDKGQKFAFLLGAGASISSGISGAGALAKKWLSELKDIDPANHKKIIDDKLFDEDDIAASYTKIYQARFQHVPHDGYQAIEAIMTDERVHPSFGYTVLAQVLTETIHNIVLTTNFDRLTETALLIYRNTHGKVIAHERMLSLTEIHHDKPSVYKIHRDMHFAPISDETGVKELNIQWDVFVGAVLKQYNLICLGYGGNDNGLMTMLSEQLQNTSNANIYWCYLEDSKPDLSQLVSECEQQLKMVKVAGFDEFMFRLNHALGFDSIDEQIRAISKKRQELEDKALELANSIAKAGDLEEAKELVAETWQEVQVEIDNTDDINEKDRIYNQGLRKFPDNLELNANYSLFLYQIKSDSEKAEHYFKKALEVDPYNPKVNGQYAVFLQYEMKNYDEAEKRYKKALESSPDDPTNNGNYALFLAVIRKEYIQANKYYKFSVELGSPTAQRCNNYANFLTDIMKDDAKAKLYYLKALSKEPNNADFNNNYASFLFDKRIDLDKAEEHFLKALQLDPKNSDTNGNFAGFLLSIGRKSEALPYLEFAEENAEKENLKLELGFYRLALFPECYQNSKMLILKLLDEGFTSPGWDLSPIIKQAEKQGNENIEELKELAARISAV